MEHQAQVSLFYYADEKESKERTGLFCLLYFNFEKATACKIILKLKLQNGNILKLIWRKLLICWYDK